MKATERGFTTIELLITMVVIAVLVGVALPSYTRYTTRAKRTAAQAVMHTALSRQEQYMLNARSYYPAVSGTTSNLAPLGVNVPPEVAASYDIKVTSANTATPPTYYVEAVPIGGQASADARCGTLKVTNDGAKSASGGASDCWR